MLNKTQLKRVEKAVKLSKLESIGKLTPKGDNSLESIRERSNQIKVVFVRG
jgi:hypothetical protein